MNNFIPRVILPATIIATTVVLGYSQAVKSLSPYEVAEIAKEITVIIRGPGSDGSGTIIGRKGNTYFVLTAGHVVDNIHPTEEADVEIYNKRLYPINTRKIVKIPDVDLAVVQFTSRENFKIPEIGNSEALHELAPVYVAGYPLSGEAIRQDFNITQGTISSLDTFNDAGYDLVYTNITKGGMSGGPVLNEYGQIVGIHGRAEGSRVSGIVVKQGFNLGIPIKVFLTKVSKLGLNVELKISISTPTATNSDTSPPVTVQPQPVEPPKTPPKTQVVRPSTPPPVITPQPTATPVAVGPTSPIGYLDKLIADDGNSGDLFGYAVAMRGNYALVGSAYSDLNAKPDSGAAYLFDLGRQLKTKLLADDGTAGNLFGYAVDIDGNYALVGSAYNDRKGTDSGLAYIFNLNSGEQTQRFSPNDGTAGDLFGYSVAIQGRYALVGAPHSDQKGHDSGSAYLFEINSGRQVQKFMPQGGGAGDLFGHSVALEGKYALVSAAYNDSKGVDSGAVYLFDITTGKQMQKLIPDDGKPGDVFGYAIAMRGKYALISSVYSDAKGVDSGAVYLFDLKTARQIHKFTANDGTAGDRFGNSVAFNNQYVLIGAPYHDTKGVDSGAVYLFDPQTGQQIRKITANDGNAGDLFGYAVAMENKYALIGSAYDDDNNKVDNGSAYIFDLNSGMQIHQFE